MTGTIQSVFGYNPAVLTKQDDPSLKSTTDCIGIEVEIEGVPYEFSSDHTPEHLRLTRFINIDPSIKYNLEEVNKYWSVVKDNSLRNGSEYVFTHPLNSINISGALSSLHKFLNTYKRNNGEGAKVSNRCSIHVHLDVRAYSKPELDRLILTYVYFERILFKYVNPSRMKNNYCRPVTDSQTMFNIYNLLTGFKNVSSDMHSYIRENFEKYTALNLIPITRYGSVEFRHHEGTSDIEMLKDWVNIIFSIVIASRNYTINDLLEMHSSVGNKQFLMEIFGGTSIGTEEFMEAIPESDLDWLMTASINDVKYLIDFEFLTSVTNKFKTSPRKGEGIFTRYFEKVFAEWEERYKKYQAEREEQLARMRKKQQEVMEAQQANQQQATPSSQQQPSASDWTSVEEFGTLAALANQWGPSPLFTQAVESFGTLTPISTSQDSESNEGEDDDEEDEDYDEDDYEYDPFIG